MNNIVLQTFWFFLPAMTANMAPVLVRHSRFLWSLAYPLDGGYVWRGQRVLGDHKTVSGLTLGLLAGALTGLIQHFLYTFPSIQSISLLSYETGLKAIGLGLLLGGGALLGDALKSFAKRRINIAPGKSWMPFDQIDLALGAIAASWWLGVITIAHAVIATVGIGIASYIVSVVGVYMRVKKSL